MNRLLLSLLIASITANCYAMRDPTQPPLGFRNESRSSSDLKVNGIFHTPNHPFAIINQKEVHIGDHINQAEVIQITENEVKVLRNNRVIDLPLFSVKTD